MKVAVVLAGMVLGALILGLTTLPAHADPRIGYSTDGRTFTESLDTPMFDPALRWVPGDTRTATVWIRNQSADPAELVVRLDADPELSTLVADGALEVRATVAGRRGPVVENGAPLGTARLEAQQAAEVEVVLRFLVGSPNSTQRTVGSFSLGVSLTQVAAVEGAGAGITDDPPASGGNGEVGGGGAGAPGTDQGPGGVLAGTGGPLLIWAVLGLGAVGGGAALLRRWGRP